MDVSHGGPPARTAWSRHLPLLAESEPGRRNRRTFDLALLAVAAVVLGLSGAVAYAARRQDRELADALATVFGWAGGFWRAIFIATLVLAVAIVVEILLRRRWDLARDVLVALAILFAAAVILGGVVISDWFPLKLHVLAQWGYPELRLAAAAAALVVVGPEVVRPVRVVAFYALPLAALAAVVIEAALPSAALAALALGLGAAVLVRLIFGSAAGVPPVAEIRDALLSLGLEVSDLKPAAQQRIGAADYVGHDRSRHPLRVRVLGRDAQDTQRIARRWRSLAYRDPPRSAPVGRLEQVEHQALATLMAAQAGVRVPPVVTAALGPNGDALIATEEPEVEPLERLPPEEVTDEMLADLWEQVASLQRARISHGRLNASNVLVVDDGPMLVDLSSATIGAPQTALDIDLAELMVASTILVGPDRALRKAREAGWGPALGRVLPYLQRAALTPHLRDLARTHEVDLEQLRKATAEAAGQEEPEITPLRRVRLRDLVTAVALVAASYLLISKLADIGFGTIAHEVSKASPAWVVLALIVAQTTFIGGGIAVRGAVLTPLPLLPCVVLQSAIKFINVTVPTSAGRIGIDLRFLQRLGLPLPEAVAAGAIDDTSNSIVQGVLFLIALPFVHVTLKLSKLNGPGFDTRLIALIGGALVIGLVVVLAVPRLREKVVPPVRAGFKGLVAVARNRGKRLQLFGGTFAQELLYSLSLGATCMAYGVHLNLAELIFVNTAASVLSGVIPVPGGIGAAEATLTAGLMALGVEQTTAFAIAITQRLCTFYLPPIWGYFSLRWLNRKGYV